MGSPSKRDSVGGTGLLDDARMMHGTERGTSATVAVDCPWCGEPAEMTLDADLLRCARCRIEVALADKDDRTGAVGDARALAPERAAA